MSVVMIPSGASEAGGDGDDFGAAGVPADFGFLFAAGFLGGAFLRLVGRGRRGGRFRLSFFLQFAPFRNVRRSFAVAELGGFRVLGVVHLLYLQGFLAADNNQRLCNRQTKHFIRGEDGPLADTGGLPVLRRII